MLSLGRALIDEEVNKELFTAIVDVLHTNTVLFHKSSGERDADAISALVAIADGGIDSLYVIYWTLNLLGMPVKELFDEVHRSNMAKSQGGKVLRRNDGKILKPEGWQPPNLRKIILDKIASLRQEREVNARAIPVTESNQA